MAWPLTRAATRSRDGGESTFGGGTCVVCAAKTPADNRTVQPIKAWRRLRANMGHFSSSSQASVRRLSGGIMSPLTLEGGSVTKRENGVETKLRILRARSFS